MNESEPTPARSESTQPPVEHSDLPLANTSTEPQAGLPTDSSGAAGELSPVQAEPGGSPPVSEADVSPRSRAPRFSFPFVAVLGAIAVAVVVFDAWQLWRRPAIGRFYYPLETALRLVERSMELREASRRAGSVERALLWLGGDRPERDAEKFPKIYREILQATPGSAVAQENKPWLQAHLIVLLGELGQTNQCRAELESFGRLSNAPRFVAAVRQVYLTEPLRTHPSDLGLAAASLSAGWARDRFAARLAEAEGRFDDARELGSELLSRSRFWYRRAMAILAIELALVVSAIALLVRAWRRGGIDWRRGPDNSFAPWPASDGMATLCGSFVVGHALALFPFLVPNPVVNWVGGYFHSLLMAVPAVVIVIQCLLRPRAARFRPHFGFEFSCHALIVSLGGAIMIVGLFLAGSHVVVRVCEGFGLAGHWTEALDERLLYGNWPGKLAVLVNMALFAPFVEELLFRGVLFGTLRKRMGPLAAAGVSSAAFASIHHYSFPGMLAIFCFGFLCAMVYERTRSLGVCVAGHMLTNLMLGLFEIAILG